MLTVIETPLYQRYADAVWTPAEQEAFVDWIALNPDAGDVIAGTGGLRKVRFSRAGTGKRGGARAIYFTRLTQGQIVLVVVYAKAKFDNLPTEILKSWKDTIDECFN
jgi:hypothetical protein